VVQFDSLNKDLYPDFQEFPVEVRKRAQLKNHPNITAYGNTTPDMPGKRKGKGRDTEEYK
jgi:hypothetical protein